MVDGMHWDGVLETDGALGWFFDTLEVCPAILRLDDTSYDFEKRVMTDLNSTLLTSICSERLSM